METGIISTQSEKTTITGLNVINMDGFVEVKMISPYYGLVLQHTTGKDEEIPLSDGDEVAVALLKKCFNISSIIQAHRSAIRKDFLQLISNLEKFNNERSDIYIRNRDELMGVFMRTHFKDYCKEEAINTDKAIFNYLSFYFITNGKCAELDVRTTVRSSIKPPRFQELNPLLQEYLAKSFEERIRMLALQTMKGSEGKYDWFLSQEFIIPQQTPD